MLPSSVQEIAEVIGQERALYLVGKLPRYIGGVDGKKSSRVILYVPTLARLDDDHELVRILGRDDATKLCKEFGGLTLHPANCREIYRRFRDKSIAGMVADMVSNGLPNGYAVEHVANLFGVSGRTVRNVCAA
ncbi:hypothetical protein ACQCRI_15150 [Ralstonia pseudosolanacearum]|uniref:hypothetical protein n=1 Tax=Ralstonia pseudosolanacearum TaxID=1310165 RepID=UPI000B9A0CA1|nr:hypothetical protein [Ralstonia sp. RS647]AST86637.1 hypothetical protein CIG66_09325 [Ralstonia pseudosolanacearum]NKA07977.1 hypothetical protein [Ralstonia solanacearum]QKL61875.1 hypothetical protein HI812_09520 [Ralstonia solanacearum]QKL66676.1 hypothetical protein HI808_09520 [Ralstonia solanacearum]QKM42908.1 hypothetical protein HI792_09460 [Ralstonia solanacearum]